MSGNKLYSCFQYFLSFMALLCALIYVTNRCFDANYEAKCIVAIIDTLIVGFFVKKWVKTNPPHYHCRRD